MCLHLRLQQLATALGTSFAEYDQLVEMAEGYRPVSPELIQRADAAFLSLQSEAAQQRGKSAIRAGRSRSPNTSIRTSE
jgi:hypothetical protein